MQKDKRYRRRRAVIWTFLITVAVIMITPMSGYLFADSAQAQATSESNVRANFWRTVRGGSEGYTAVKGQETNVLIQNGGQNWRNVRNGPLITYGWWILAASLSLIAVFYLIRGQIKLENGRSGMTVPRWSLFNRTLHWITAILFLILMVTGLSLLYGKHVLIPLLGKDGFSLYAGFAKDVHNYVGPAFGVTLFLEIILWVKNNIPNATDIKWLFSGGGIIGNAHPSAGRMNGGEKMWFWLLTLGGGAVVATGLALNFPGYGQTRELLQYAHLIHVAAGIVLIAFAFGHIYIGTAGTQGALEGMTTGRVDTEWAQQHHDLWYQELMDKGVKPEPAGEGKAATAPRPNEAPATG